MSGPIVRKYGFPNFEKIFGQRPLEHGVDEEPGEKPAGSTPAGKEDKAAGPSKNRDRETTPEPGR